MGSIFDEKKEINNEISIWTIIGEGRNICCCAK